MLGVTLGWVIMVLLLERIMCNPKYKQGVENISQPVVMRVRHVPDSPANLFQAEWAYQTNIRGSEMPETMKVTTGCQQNFAYMCLMFNHFPTVLGFLVAFGIIFLLPR